MQLGSIVYSSPNASAFVPGSSAAVNGLSINGTGQVVLGNDVGVPAPAVLLSNRQVPLGGFNILWSGQTTLPAFTFKQSTSPNLVPVITFQNNVGTEISRLTIPDNQTMCLGAGAGGNLTGNNIGIFIGNTAGGGITSGQSDIAIGPGAMQGNGGLTNFGIGIGQDCFDRNGAAISDHVINIGHNSISGGAGKTVGTNFINIGNRNSSGANADIIGAEVTVIGHRSNVGGSLTNTIVLANFNNGVSLLTLSNVIVIGTSIQNILIGQTVAAWADNGNRLQVSGKMNTGGAAPLTLGAGAMDFGKIVTAASVLNATKYWEISVDGVLVKVCIN
jgi:hypothetical protein